MKVYFKFSDSKVLLFKGFLQKFQNFFDILSGAVGLYFSPYEWKY